MFCNQCGSQIPDGSKFCHICGANQIIPQTGVQEVPTVQPSYDYGVQQPVQPSYEQAYQQPSYAQTAPQGTQPNYEKQPQPVNERKVKPAKAPKKKLPAWAKILIAVCVIAVVGVATFLTIHIIKGKKGGKAYITIDGVRCDITDGEGLKNFGKVDKLVTVSRNGLNVVYELCRDGKLVSGEDFNLDDYSVRVEKTMGSISNDVGGITIYLGNNADFSISDGASPKASVEDLEKLGYVWDGRFRCNKLFDENGAISLDSIDDDYDTFLTLGWDSLDYNLNTGFPDDLLVIKNDFDGKSKEENRNDLIEKYSGSYNVKNFDDFFRYRLLLSREIGKITGLKGNDYVGSTKDFVVLVSVEFESGEYGNYGDYVSTTITIYGKKEKLNSFVKGWGLPDTMLYQVDSRITTEEYTRMDELLIDQPEPQHVIADEVEIPIDYDTIEVTTEAPVPSYEPYDIANLPEEIDNFLGNFGWYSYWAEEYDSEGYIDYDRFYSSFFSIDIGLYNIDYYDNVYISDEVVDPLNKFEYGAYGIDGYRADFVLKNVYNWTDDMIQAAKDNVDSYYYFYDGNYYAFVGGVGGGFVPQIKSVEFNGERYHITYDLYSYGEGDEFLATHYAELEYKVIDGKGYWSIYKDSTTSFF